MHQKLSTIIWFARFNAYKGGMPHRAREEAAVTIIQVLVLVIGFLALLLSSELLRSTIKQRRRAVSEPSPSFRQVGTFGGLGHFAAAAPLPSGGSSGRPALSIFVLATFLGTGAAVKYAWDETHPDLRSAYGRAYERCVAEGSISRWKVEEVERCIHSGRSYDS
jgi:hypothetical protein